MHIGILEDDTAQQELYKLWFNTPQNTCQCFGTVRSFIEALQTVRFDLPFMAPDGTPIMYPHADRVPSRHTLGCKCRAEYRIDYTGWLLRQRAN